MCYSATEQQHVLSRDEFGPVGHDGPAVAVLSGPGDLLGRQGASVWFHLASPCQRVPVSVVVPLPRTGRVDGRQKGRWCSKAVIIVHW